MPLQGLTVAVGVTGVQPKAAWYGADERAQEDVSSGLEPLRLAEQSREGESGAGGATDGKLVDRRENVKAVVGVQTKARIATE
ncbi:MAG: hypothetical protein AAGG01_17830 [Planctomycetota bacterium]